MLETGKLLYGVPMQDYLKDPGHGSSTVSYIVPPYTPQEFYENLKNPFFKGSNEANLGTFIHSAVGEPDSFDDIYVYEPERFDKRTKAGKEKSLEFKTKAEGKIVIPFGDRPKIEAAVKAVSEHPEISEIYKSGFAEVTGVAWFSKHLVEGGLRFKSREDWITPDGMIWDIKTTSSPVDEKSLAWTIYKYKYHFKAYHHMEVMRRCDLDVKGFGWVFITTHLPVCRVVAVTMSPVMEAAAARQHQEAVALLAKCTSENKWPGFYEPIKPINLPRGIEELSTTN